MQHLAGEGERGREPWRFNSEEVHEAANTVHLMVLNHEILCWSSGPHDFRSDARISRTKPALVEIGPIPPNCICEPGQPRLIDRIVDTIDPLDIGTEPGLAGKVEGQMCAKAARHRDRVDKP